MSQNVKKKSVNIPEGQKKYSGNKLLVMPGIREAIDLVQGHAWVRAVNEVIELGAKGELGGEVESILKNLPARALDELLKNETAICYVYDSYDEWLEILAFEVSSKIAEFWCLSEVAQQRLANLVYWGEGVLSSKGDIFSPLVLLVNAKGDKDIETLNRHLSESNKHDCFVVSPAQVRKGHIYLDVTEITYSRFRSAYKAIDLCRKYLGLKKTDLQPGAPSKINVQKALEAAYLKNSQQSSKSIAKTLGFKIYTADNPSGSYPLLHKYLKIGKVLEERLVKLDKFLSTITIESS